MTEILEITAIMCWMVYAGGAVLAVVLALCFRTMQSEVFQHLAKRALLCSTASGVVGAGIFGFLQYNHLQENWINTEMAIVFCVALFLIFIGFPEDSGRSARLP